MFDTQGRERKARTMVAVLQHHLAHPLNQLSLLNVGGSAGIIDNYLSGYLGRVVGVDIDEKAIQHATAAFAKQNLSFEVGDAMSLRFSDASFDVVVCSQVYEHVPDSTLMMKEIHRVLRVGGVCYFAAGNRLMWNEPHYGLPLLSVVPRPLAHLYMRMAGRGPFYYEKHLSYWGLKALVRRFDVRDYTLDIIKNPNEFAAEYLLPPGSLKSRVAAFIASHLIWLVPGYIWVLVKRPEEQGDSDSGG